MHCVKCKGMYKRAEYQTIKDRVEEERRFIQVVMGPRQVGKSTVVRQVLNDINQPFLVYSADNVPATNTAWVADCWAATRSLMTSKGYEGIILVAGNSLAHLFRTVSLNHRLKKSLNHRLKKSLTIGCIGVIGLLKLIIIM